MVLSIQHCARQKRDVFQAASVSGDAAKPTRRALAASSVSTGKRARAKNDEVTWRPGGAFPTVSPSLPPGSLSVFYFLQHFGHWCVSFGL
jgi:hypothetical protein